MIPFTSSYNVVIISTLSPYSVLFVVYFQIFYTSGSDQSRATRVVNIWDIQKLSSLEHT